MLQYSQKLINEVLRLYPDNAEIQKCLNDGNRFLGMYLGDKSHFDIAPVEVLAVETMSDLQLLKTKARDILAKRDLYDLWKSETADIPIRHDKHRKQPIKRH